ncbi:MAG: histidinol-phosphate transaminase [Anaeroplasmataceae bacterium]
MKYLRKDLNGMVPYSTPYLTSGVILNANESPFNLPREIIDLFYEELKRVNFNRYPDMNGYELKNALAKVYGLEVSNIAIGDGSDELLQCLFNAICEENTKVVVMNPSFSMYSEYAHIYRASVIKVDCNDDFSFNLESMISCIKKNNPKLVILCSPNNPTGILLTKEEVLAIINSTDGLVLLDEAYVEFAGEGLIDLTKKYDNLMVIRTFSKLYAGASIRLGYAISKKENIDLIDTVRSPYNVNTLTQILAKTIIEHKDLYNDIIEYFKSAREKMYNELNELGIKVYPSHANFLWMELNNKIVTECDKLNIYIRKMKFNGKDYNRVTIGTKEENELFMKVVRENA